jgi:hypothetical protein
VRLTATCILLLLVRPAFGQVDPARAATYFKEAAALCERDNGKLWGISLCGPIVIADAATQTIATNQQAPAARRPAALGFANAAMDWGGVRWTTIVWQLIPSDPEARGRLMMHELFHRVQPQLGFVVRDGQNDHLDSVDGRYWLQLEWRALAKALASSGDSRNSALRDALAFRMARRKLFPSAAENERPLEMNEGLAQYTGTVTSFGSRQAATDDAIRQLSVAEQAQSFVRTFAYPSGAAYGILLDEWAPGWTRKVKYEDDFGQLVMAAAAIEPFPDPDEAAKRYEGVQLRTSEEKRGAEHRARVTELRRRFVDGPVLVLPPPRNASFLTAGITPIGVEGTVYPTFRTTTEWGTLQADLVLMSPDRSRLTLPAPAGIEGTVLRGDGWTLTIATGWVVRPGSRSGDFQLVREN